MTGYVWQRWMVEDFRAAGLVVHEVEGWENRGRPASTGGFDPRGQQTKHHTGVTSSPANPHPTLSTLIFGRSDLPGPLAQWSTGADGTVYVIAAGRCNHAGRVGKSGVPGMPFGADGNALAMGDEIDTNGTQVLPEAQRRAVAIASRVCLERFQAELDYIHRHADISSTGKWDIGSLSTQQLRDDADAATTHREDITIMDADTRKYLDAQFSKSRAQVATVKKAVKAVASGLEAVAETVQTGDEKIRARITKSKRELADAIAALDAPEPVTDDENPAAP